MTNTIRTARDARRESEVAFARSPAGRAQAKADAQFAADVANDAFATAHNVGKLIRKGRPVYYVTAPVYAESTDPRALVEAGGRMNTERKPVDVLAVIDATLARTHHSLAAERDDLREARAAVAELIEAAQAALRREEFKQGADAGNDGLVRSLRAALARVGGAS